MNRHKNTKNTIKQNPAIYKKDNTLKPSGIYPKNARLVQQIKTNQSV